MNQPDTEITRNRIVIIQSLCGGDYKTGEHLFDELRYRQDIVPLFFNVASKAEFVQAIESIKGSHIDGDVLTLQLETHGCEAGIAFSNNDIMNWKEFHDLMRELNVMVGGLLGVCMAMCYGGATISTIEANKRAPYRVIVAPFKEVPAIKVEEGFIAFYSSYRNILDLPDAIRKLQETCKDENDKPYFSPLSAEQIFDQTFNPDRDPSHFKAMVEYHCMKLTGGLNPADLQNIEKQIRSLMEASKISFRSYYLFHDVYKKE